MIRSFIQKTDLPRQNGIITALKQILNKPSLTILDVGCGSGKLAARLQKDNPGWIFQGIDVVLQPNCPIPVSLFNGVDIPFADNSFDVVFCLDMLHHSDNPKAILSEAARIARHWVVVKDHEARNRWDHYMLTCLDWLGNAGTGVPLPYRFLSPTEWQVLFQQSGLQEAERCNALRYWPGLLGYLIDRRYHFISKLAAPKTLPE